jgi:hypothetical protein
LTAAPADGYLVVRARGPPAIGEVHNLRHFPLSIFR